MVFSDPPSNVPIDGHVSGLGAIRHRPFPMAAGEMLQSSLHRLSQLGLPEPRGLQRRWLDPLHLYGLASSQRAAHRRPRRLLRAQKCLHLDQGQWRNGAHCTAVSTSSSSSSSAATTGIAIISSLAGLAAIAAMCGNTPGSIPLLVAARKGNLLALHPTVTPVAMVADAMRDCSARGDIVLDAFLGSGTTVIAAERTGRRCYGLELDAAYVDTAIRRWQAQTGGSARHAASGRSFDDLAREAADAA
jgi:hypothetical protein